MTVKVSRTYEVTINPRAECLGNNPDPDAPSNCPYRKDPSTNTLAMVRAHIKTHPTHQMLVVREVRSVYEANN